jgi:hypothetical protein
LESGLSPKADSRDRPPTEVSPAQSAYAPEPGGSDSKMLELPASAVNRFSVKPFSAAPSRSFAADRQHQVPPYSAEFCGILPNSSRPAEKILQGHHGPADMRFTHESGCCGLSEVQTGLRTCSRAYCQAFIKKL